jgi:hypothetical protein
MLLLLLLAKLPRRPRLISGWVTTAAGLIVMIAGVFAGLSLVIDGAIVLVCGLFLLLSLRIDPARVRARLGGLRAR